MFLVPVPLGDMPEEMRKHIEMHQMSAEATRERLINWLNNLSPEDLGTLYDWVKTAAISDEPKAFLHTMVGYCQGLFNLKHHTYVCGRDHDQDKLAEERDRMAAEGKLIIPNASDDLDEIVRREVAAKRQTETPGEKLDQLIEEAPLEQPEADGAQPSLFSAVSKIEAEELANHMARGTLAEAHKLKVTPEVKQMAKDLVTQWLVEYRVTPIGTGVQVKCDGCGLVYVNLADRMVKRPDNCHGCHMKSAHG